MSDTTHDSNFFLRLNAGKESAAEQVDRKYRDRLCHLVAKQLGQRYRSREEPEDLVQSAMRSFYRGIDVRRFQIDHSAALWKLLEKITLRKILRHVEYHQAEKRRPQYEVHPPSIQALGREPTPEDAIAFTDMMEKVLEGLKPPAPEVLRMRLEGHRRREIAEKLGCSESRVSLYVDRVRDRMKRLLAEEEDF